MPDFVFLTMGTASNFPRVYPTICKPDIPITCDLAGAETSQSTSRWASIPGVAHPSSLGVGSSRDTKDLIPLGLGVQETLLTTYNHQHGSRWIFQVQHQGSVQIILLFLKILVKNICESIKASISFYVMFKFNHGNNNLPRVYPTACKPDIPITCNLARAKTSQWGRLPFKPCHSRPNEQPYPPSVLNLWPPER